MTDTQTTTQPPKKPPENKSVASQFSDDDLKQLADDISSLTAEEAKKLTQYISGKEL